MCVPYVRCLYSALQFPSCLASLMQKTWPFWNRTNGADHIWLSIHDEVRKQTPTNAPATLALSLCPARASYLVTKAAKGVQPPQEACRKTWRLAHFPDARPWRAPAAHAALSYSSSGRIIWPFCKAAPGFTKEHHRPCVPVRERVHSLCFERVRTGPGYPTP